MKPPPPTAGETLLHSEGAEFLVLGQLLIRGVHASKGYTRYPGWDILASNPSGNRTCRIQVKARLASDYDGGFTIKNFDAEFVVLVALNRGFRYRRSQRVPLDDGIRDPEFYVFPMTVIADAAVGAPTWGKSSKVYRRHIEDCDAYKGAWQLIVDQLLEPRDPVAASSRPRRGAGTRSSAAAARMSSSA